MTSKKSKKYPPYWQDDRSETEIIITQRLAQKLSELNHSRIKPSIEFKNKNCLFITVGGVPPNPNQFVGFEFPGTVVNYRPPFFNRQDYTIEDPQKIKEKLSSVSMDNSCEQLKQIVENSKFEEAVFVYHSFGGSIVAWFCSKYPQKVKGLICLGGTPIRFYPILRDYAKAYLSMPGITREFIIQNFEVIYSLYDQKTKNLKNWTRFKNKEELLSFILHNDPNTLNHLFDKIRALPLPILMIYGSRDEILSKPFCSEAMTFMCYQRQVAIKEDKKHEKMAFRFNELHQSSKKSNKEQKINLQEKFVYFIEGGHSIHISLKNNKMIQPLIDEYLYTILDGDIVSGKGTQYHSIRSKL